MAVVVNPGLDRSVGHELECKNSGSATVFQLRNKVYIGIIQAAEQSGMRFVAGTELTLAKWLMSLAQKFPSSLPTTMVVIVQLYPSLLDKTSRRQTSYRSNMLSTHSIQFIS
ncbi:hypothetical protein QTP70_010832 [Hemibagrus guttatus]|uniref:Uncharacterized protein n=1 Tax=Hemibagrus guttatus TaxID=175788 RepID=A0AAE0RL27_9TELE|nr:hypothetical protein QTP70_010832 [Hemibagrus guttatus]